MRFSIFEDDNTLGLDNARVVVLRGSTTVNRLFNSSAFPIDSWIRTALVNANFDVVAVRYSWQSSLPFGGNGVNVEIECNVFNNFTAEQARVNAITAIEAYTANLGLNKPFYNTTLVATIFDEAGNAIAASQTFVPTLSSQGTAPLTFTWNQAFAAPVARVEILPVPQLSRLVQ